MLVPSGSLRSPAWIVTMTFAGILLLAAVLRLAAMHEVPPGLQHDEMFKALEGRRLLDVGELRLFYQTNQGHEGGYVWALAVSFALLGVSALSIKFPAFVFGMLTVALTIRLAGRLAGHRAAVLAGLLSALLFFSVLTSRVGLRASMLPVFVLWFLLALNGILKDRGSWIAAGLALGLSIYTYTSAFALWGAFGALAVALALFERPRLRAVWRPLASAVLLAAMISAPMLVARATDPEGFNRSSTITRPLTDALAGRPQELFQNGLKLLGMAAFTGDPEARYNVPGRPLFPLPVGLLVYAGIGLAGWHVRRQPLLAAMLGITAVGLVPSLLTVSAPSFLRVIAVLPCLIIFAAIAIDRLSGQVGWGLAAVALAVVALADVRALFVDWPRTPEVKAIYRDDLEQLARAVRAGDALWVVSTPDVEQDSLLFSLYAGDDAARVGFFDGDTTVVFINGERLAISPLAPLTPPHRPFAEPDYGAQGAPDISSQYGDRVFAVYDVVLNEAALTRLDDAGAGRVFTWSDDDYPRGALEDWADTRVFPVNFGGIVELAGVELADRVVAPEFDGVNVQLVLRPLAVRPDLSFSVFVHVYRQNNGQLHAQRDMLGMPPSQWLPGVTIVQDNFVVMGRTRPGWYLVAIGVYNVVTGERLPVIDADGAVVSDRILIGRVRVED